MDERQTIWKFPFSLGDHAELVMPQASKIIHVAESNEPGLGEFCAWAMVYPSLPTRVRRLGIYGTGHPLPPAAQAERFLGTVQLGIFVWHIFDEGESVQGRIAVSHPTPGTEDPQPTA